MRARKAARRIGIFLLSVATIPLADCADHAKLTEWEAAGWRIGQVQQIVELKDLKSDQDLACVSHMSPDRRTSLRFAVVWYPHSIGARGHSALTVPIPDLLELNVGDTVQINILDCKKPIVRRAG
jgi:hypothetical protein